MRKSQRTIISVALLTGVIIAYLVTASPQGSRSIRQFDPDRMANLEVRMWQAYYAQQHVHLFGLLVTMLREQYRYSWARAVAEGYHLARAAATFANLHSGYEAVLPNLEAAYGMAKRRTGATFDP